MIRPKPNPYLVSLLAVLAACLLRVLVAGIIDLSTPFQFFLAAVVLSAWWGGIGAGIVATLLAAGVADLFFAPRDESLLRGDSAGVLPLALFLVEGLLISFLSGQLHKFRARASAGTREVKGARARATTAESFYRVLTEEVKDFAIFRLDPSGLIVSWNTGAEKLFGYMPEEIIGQPGEILFTPEDREEGIPDRELNDARDTGRAEDERWHLRKDGSRFFADGVTTLLHDAAGQVVGFSKVARDGTDRKVALEERKRLLELEQQARRDAESANRAKDEFLATLSHELRTPMTAIIGWASMLRMGGLDAPTIASAVETIEKSAKAQAQLIDDLLDVSRIVSGKLRLDFRPVDLASVVSDAIEAVQPTAELRGIRIVAKDLSSVGPVMGDENRLQQVIWNLLTNAIKFSPNDTRVEIVVLENGALAEIHVIDQGQGIHPEFLPYVFDRFRQEESSANRSHSGLGLGLSIVRNLIEQHGGAVRATSAGEGQGATFVVSLPLVTAKKLVSPPPRLGSGAIKALPRLNGIRVLLVDDENDVLVLLDTVLTRCGAEVETASSAAEAFERFSAQTPDVLLSDIGMPGEDGYKLVERIRRYEAEKGLEHCPAIAVTAFAGPKERVRILSAGFQSYLQKPVDVTELALVVAAMEGRIGEGGGADPSASELSDSRH